jgi:hypothetical protein
VDQRAAGASSVATSPSGEVTAPLGPPGGISSSGAPPWTAKSELESIVSHPTRKRRRKGKTSKTKKRKTQDEHGDTAESWVNEYMIMS